MENKNNKKFNPFSDSKKQVDILSTPQRPNLFTERKPTIQIVQDPANNMSLPPQAQPTISQKYPQNLFTAFNNKGTTTTIGDPNSYKKPHPDTKQFEDIIAQNNAQPQEQNKSTFQNIPKSIMASTQNTPIVEQEKPGFFDSLFKSKPGEYSTAREIGTGIANFAEHFGNSLSGAGNQGTVDRWNQIRQEYREKNPESDVSKLFQRTYGKLGIDSAGKSAWDLKQIHPDINSLLQKQQMGLRGTGNGKPAREDLDIDPNFTFASNTPLEKGEIKEVREAKSNYDQGLNRINEIKDAIKRQGGSNLWTTPLSDSQKIRDKELIEGNIDMIRNAKAKEFYGILSEAEANKAAKLIKSPGVTTTDNEILAGLDKFERDYRNAYHGKLTGYGYKKTGADKTDIANEIARRAGEKK